MKRDLAVVKFVEKELGRSVGVALGTFMGILLLLHGVTAITSSDGQSLVNGVDTILYLVLFICIIVNFKRHAKFIFQNSVAGSVRSRGLYLAHALAGVAIVPATLFLGSVMEPLFRLVGINTNGFVAFPLISEGAWHWRNFGIALLTGLIVSTLGLLLSLINYHLGGWKTFVFWAAVIVLGQIILAVFWLILTGNVNGEIADTPALIRWLAQRGKELLVWLQGSYWHQAFVAVGIVAVISAFDLVILKRLQLRQK